MNGYSAYPGAGGSPNQMNVGMAGVAEGAPVFGNIGAMGSQMQQPMFGNSSMNRSPIGGMGQQRSSPYKPHPEQPGYYIHPEYPGQRYEQPRPGYFRPSDQMPEPPPNQFRIPNIFHQGPNQLDPELVPVLEENFDHMFDFDGPYLFSHPLPDKVNSGVIGTTIENNPFFSIDFANLFGISTGDENIDKVMAWLDTEHGQMFMNLYQDALDDLK